MARRAICATACCTNPRGHNVRLLDLVNSREEREWYVKAAIQHGWSRDVLIHQIESGLYRRQGAATTNFDRVLPPSKSDLAQQITKYRITVGNQDFYIDLLFYHLNLRAFVVIDLKTGAFQPEFAGKMSFYLSAVDDLLRHPADQPSIGIILCKTRERVVAEYALRDINRPIGVSEYRLAESLPEALRGKLPTIEELETELDQGLKGSDQDRTDSNSIE